MLGCAALTQPTILLTEPYCYIGRSTAKVLRDYSEINELSILWAKIPAVIKGRVGTPIPQ